MPWSPLAGGWLAGKYKRDEMPTGATRLGENPNRGMEAYEARNAQERTWAVLDAVSDIANAHGCSAAQISLAWLAAQPAVTSVILGARTIDQLKDNMASAEVKLTAEDLQKLDEVSRPRMADYPYGPQGIAQRNRKIEGGR